jgi:hypothetical protein
MNPVTGLALGRIVIGSLSLVNPDLAAKLFLLDARANRQLPYMTRMFGSREIALGALTLVSSGAARRRLIQFGVAIDGADAFTGIAATSSGAVPKTTGLMMAAAAVGAVATGVMGLLES